MIRQNMNKLLRSSRNKIIATIMGALGLILLGTLLIIFFTTYSAVYRNSQNLLRVFAEDYLEGKGPKGVPDESDDIPEMKVFEDASVMYLVGFSENGEVIDIMNDVKPFMSNDDLAAYAKSLADGERNGGVSGRLIYVVVEKNDNTYVVMMDNTLISSSMKTLILNTVIYGCAALVILFFVSLKVADGIMKPIDEMYKKQKLFISDAGHELKTPISTVSANAELLQREIGDNRWLDNIIFENHRMKELVKELLDLSRTENIETVKEDVDFSKTVMGGMLPFDSVAFEKGLLIESSIAPDIHVSGDLNELGKLLSTLIDNAISHADTSSEKNKNICVNLFASDKKAVLEVSNPGKEIPPDDIEKIFERFYRTDSSRKLNGHYGLGLAIAKAITENHGGNIGVKCADGITTFFVELPMVR
ncbi:MAG: HAMP domain-containing histidine kinase [Butyrivibrio sp.]|uniref:sensor histidine kinase n=1 Tax=Butyrivibrio sp. TaxID=28121 RepID=UPI001B1FAC55|nr:HAMP domain-containing sensor histidine kinase [Butyrivibrio sp.]MBO6239617.1 HAMP domain-containing histidine kinase [Butyrivibrio sp.]